MTYLNIPIFFFYKMKRKSHSINLQANQVEGQHSRIDCELTLEVLFQKTASIKRKARRIKNKEACVKKNESHVQRNINKLPARIGVAQV